MTCPTYLLLSEAQAGCIMLTLGRGRGHDQGADLGVQSGLDLVGVPILLYR